MRRPNPSSIRFRAAAWSALSLAILVLASAAAVHVLVSREVRAAADSVLIEQAQDRAQLLANGADPASLVTVVGDEVVAAVIGPTDVVLASAGTSDASALASIEPGVRTVTVAIVEEEHDSGGDEAAEPHVEEIRVAVAEVTDGSRVVVGNEGEQTRRTIANVRTVLAIGGPAMAFVVGGLVWVLIGAALQPVYAMRDDLDRVIGAGTGGRIGEPGTRDEVDDLARTMNDVLDRLERQSAARRQFVADASHELKSPLANARVLVETGGSSTMAMSELDRLQALVEDLLFLARTDEADPARPAVVDLDDVAFDEAERAAIRTELLIDASGVQPAQVIADRDELARAVRNLVENAVRHGAGQVTIGIEARPERWALIVTDDGPGIAPADRERIFERFARLDPDRSRGDGGTGLGLSIVAAIAERNDGAVSVADHDGPGARLELVLPRAQGDRRRAR